MQHGCLVNQGSLDHFVSETNVRRGEGEGEGEGGEKEREGGRREREGGVIYFARSSSTSSESKLFPILEVIGTHLCTRPLI